MAACFGSKKGICQMFESRFGPKQRSNTVWCQHQSWDLYLQQQKALVNMWKRAHIQAAIWLSAMSSHPLDMDPDQFGWTKKCDIQDIDTSYNIRGCSNCTIICFKNYKLYVCIKTAISKCTMICCCSSPTLFLLYMLCWSACLQQPIQQRLSWKWWKWGWWEWYQ